MNKEDLEARYANLRTLAEQLSQAIDVYLEHVAQGKEGDVPYVFWTQHLRLKAELKEHEWRTGVPDHKRNVLARITGPYVKPMTIVAFYGSEGKWCACDHDGRVTYLEEGTVSDWREMPQ